MDFLKKYWGLPVVLILSIFSVLPLLNSGFFPMHDDTQVARVFEMGKALKDGMFPVRWVQDLGYGYGYPIFNFYAPLAYYIGGFFNVAGFDALVSTKIMMVIGILLSGIFMYLLSREFWGEIGGLVSGLFYMYAPYHAVDIYVRGDVAEFWAYAFIPLAFFGFYKMYCHSGPSVLSLSGSKDLSRIRSSLDSGVAKLSLSPQNDNPMNIQNLWRWVIIGSLGYAGVILSHNLTAMMTTPFLLILIAMSLYIGIKKKQLSTFNFQLSTIILGILLSAFYWFPALMEMKYTNVLSQIGGGADFKDHFVCVQQLWNSGWGFGGSAKDCIDGMSFKLGKLHILLLVLSIFITIAVFTKAVILGSSALKNDSRIGFWTSPSIPRDSGPRDQNDKIRITVILLSFFGVFVSIFLTLDLSKPIWEIIPLMSFFQYPWRFLILTSFFTSFLAGSVIWFIEYVIARNSAKQNDEAIYVGRRLPRFARNDGKRVLPYIVSAVLVFLLIFLNAKLFNPQTIISKTVIDYTSDYALKWEASKLSDEYLPKNFVKPKSFFEIKKNEIYSKNYPEHTFIQKSANFLSLAGMLMLILGIIYSRSNLPFKYDNKKIKR